MNTDNYWRKQRGQQIKEVFDLHGKDFHPEFRSWLRENFDLYLNFERRSDEMRNLRPRYSARTIVELLRWHSDLQDAEVSFKINNNSTRDMARLYNRLTGTSFFEEREHGISTN